MDSFMNWGSSFHPETVALHLYLLLYQVAIYLGQTFLWYNSFRLSNLTEIVSSPNTFEQPSCLPALSI